MNTIKKIAIQGYRGAFHEEAAIQYFSEECIDTLDCRTFPDLFESLSKEEADGAIVAIENSIAGSILQNYRLLREHKCFIEGEIYLRIRHQLLVNPGIELSSIRRIASHPMALNQCLQYIEQLGECQLIETEDTALSARNLAHNPQPDLAVIASARAAKFYGLHTIAPNIETHRHNYTRFLVINRHKAEVSNPDKASIYLQIEDKKGSLLAFLKLIDDCDVNISKLQSFPVLGNFRAYYFHIDLEFDQLEQYTKLKHLAIQHGFTIEELGLYRRADRNIIFE